MVERRRELHAAARDVRMRRRRRRASASRAISSDGLAHGGAVRRARGRPRSRPAPWRGCRTGRARPAAGRRACAQASSLWITSRSATGKRNQFSSSLLFQRISNLCAPYRRQDMARKYSKKASSYVKRAMKQAQEGHAQERQRPQGQEQEAGDRHRPVGSAQEGRQGPEAQEGKEEEDLKLSVVLRSERSEPRRTSDRDPSRLGANAPSASG